MSLFFRRKKTYTKLYESGVDSPHIRDEQISKDGNGVSVVTLYDSFVIIKVADGHYDIEQYTKDKVLMERSHIHISRIHDIGMYKHSEKDGYEMAIMLTSGEYVWFHGSYEAITKMFDFVKSFTLTRKEEPKPVKKEEPKPVKKEESKPVKKEEPKSIKKEEPKSIKKKTKAKPVAKKEMYPSLELEEKHLQAELEAKRKLIDEEAFLKKSQREKAFPSIPQYNPPIFPSIPQETPPLRQQEGALIDFWQ